MDAEGRVQQAEAESDGFAQARSSYGNKPRCGSLNLIATRMRGWPRPALHHNSKDCRPRCRRISKQPWLPARNAKWNRHAAR